MSAQRAKHLTEQREEFAARESAKTKCWNVLFEKWPTIREACHEHWNGPDAFDSLFEKSVLREHIEVFEHGAIMSVVIFGALRVTAHPKFHPFVDKYVMPVIRLTPKKKKVPKPKTAKNFNNDNMKAPKSVHGHNGRQFKSYLEHKRDTHVEKIHEAAAAPHDILVATIVGLSATCFFMRPQQMRLDFEEAPLSPGRSFLSEHMCDDFIKIYQETDPQVFQNNVAEHHPDANLKSFEKFALHCILRSAYVNKRIEAGEDKALVLPVNGPWEEEEGDSQSG